MKAWKRNRMFISGRHPQIILSAMKGNSIIQNCSEFNSFSLSGCSIYTSHSLNDVLQFLLVQYLEALLRCDLSELNVIMIEFLFHHLLQHAQG